MQYQVLTLFKTFFLDCFEHFSVKCALKIYCIALLKISNSGIKYED